MKHTTQARRTDPQSSHTAAQNADSSKAANIRRLCLQTVVNKPGATSAEIADALGIDRHDAARRLPDLRKAGKVCNGHPRRCRVSGADDSLTWYPTTMADAPTITQADVDAAYLAFAGNIPNGPTILQNHARDRAARTTDIDLTETHAKGKRR
jgi:hypothetical protein